MANLYGRAHYRKMGAQVKNRIKSGEPAYLCHIASDLGGGTARIELCERLGIPMYARELAWMAWPVVGDGIYINPRRLSVARALASGHPERVAMWAERIRNAWKGTTYEW